MNKIKTRFYFLFLINLSLISFSKNANCDGSVCQRSGNQCLSKYENSCSSSCKPNMFSQACYDCGNSNFYEINESTKTCVGMGSCPSFIIDGSNQCVSNCGNFYTLGDYCISSCSGNMEVKDELTRECKCNSYYYTEQIEGKTKYHCLSKCEDNHKSYDMNSKECSENDCSSSQKIKKESVINRCSSECKQGEVINIDGGTNFCLDECPPGKTHFYKDDNGQKFCTKDCSERDDLYYKKNEDECVSIHECDFIDGKECKEASDPCLHNYGSKDCVKECTGDYPYQDKDNLICYEHCPTKFIEKDTNICKNEISDCYFTEEKEYDLDKTCYDNCPEGYKQIDGTKRCVSVDNDYKYTFLQDGKYYSSCASIPNIGKSYYEGPNNECICFFYGTVNGKINCFDSEAACFDNNLKYKKKNQCLESCSTDDFIYKAQNDGKKWINECYSDYNECKEYPYHNKDLKECYLNLPQDNSYYPNKIDASGNLPIEDGSGNTFYKNKCGTQYNYLTVSKVCKEKCDDNEYFISDTVNNYRICQTQCDKDDKIYIKDGECVTLDNCDFYFEELDGKKICVDTCKKHGKFSFKKINSDDKKCYDSCVKDDKNNFYNSDNECLSSCKNNPKTNENYAYPNDDGPKKCISKPEDKCYNDSLIIVGNSCKLYSNEDPQLCVYECSGYVSNYKCVNRCPDSESFYVYTKYELSSNVDINIYKCIPQCSDANDDSNTYNFFDFFTKQCLKECDNNHEYYDDKCYPVCSGGQKYVPDPNPKPSPGTLSCTPSCSSLQMKFEKIKNSILICRSECEGTKKYIKEPLSSGGDKECVEACDETQVVKIDDHVCKSDCETGEYKIKALSRPTGVDHDIYECVKFCPTENYYFYVKEDNGVYQKVCVQKCPTVYNKMVERKYECIKNCPDEYPYYYESDKNVTGNYYKCTDHFKCNEGEFFCNGCKTIAQIKSQSMEYIENNKCVSGCTTGYKYYKYQKDDNFIYICKKECDPNEFADEYECVKNCPRGSNHIYLNNICKGSCDTVNHGNLIYKYLIETDLDYEIFMCTDKCPEKYPYSTEDYKCFNECPEGKYFSKQENHCYDNCGQSRVNTYKLDVLDTNGNIIKRKCISECNDPENYEYKYLDNNECRKTCKNNQHYVKEDSNECTSSCQTGYYIYINDNAQSNTQKNFCVKQCPASKPFSRGNQCISTCDSSEFYIKEFKHGESSLQKECFSYCPEEYPFYYETAGKKECVEKCNSGDYYFEKNNDKDNTKIDRLCLTECKKTSSVYKYKIESEASRRYYIQCPTEKKYYKLNDDDNNCYEECPPDAPFHEKSGSDKFICKKLEECNNDYVDFENGLCLESNDECPTSKKKTKYKFNDGNKYKYICSSECLPTYGKYSTYYDICVDNCENDDLVATKHLKKDPYNPECICENLFYINNGEIICFPNSIDKECRDMDNYKINLYGTKRCIQDCNSIGGILSPTEDICHQGSYNCGDYPNSIKDDSNKKCVCKDKYYIDSNRNKVCLKEGDVCPDGYQDKYVPSIKQCIKDGEACPPGYGYLFIGKYCLSNCPTGSTDNKCNNCENYWEFNNNGVVECLSECNVYIPLENNKCVTKCEGKYSYYYDGECYSSCNLNLSPEIRIKNAIEVIDPDSLSEYKCECKKEDFWYIENNIKFCVSSCFLDSKKFNYVIKETSECVNTCPSTTNPSYPYYFNNECFSSCENEAKKKYHLTVKTDTINPSNYECQCDYLWHYKNKEENIKECINENICILSNTTKKFFSPSKNECVEKCIDNGEQGFNYICYNSCPPKTIPKTDSEKIFDCFCDLDLGYWFEYEQYNGIYYSCALDECPLFHEKTEDDTYVRMNLIESEKKCVKSCRKEGSSKNENFFALRGICIKGCPDLTYTNDDNDECLFYELNDTDINSLDKFKRAANVQAKELYEKSQNLGGFLYNKFNTSLEIYAVDLKNTLKDISFKTNLTYIDFDTCIKKIFEHHNKDYLNESLTILVAKYDLLPDANVNIGKAGSNSDKYLINPVEYELFSSNKSEKLDTSVCSPYELIISYPLLLNKFDNYEGDINKNELRKKFEMGKELYHMDNSIDTFNYNNYIYNTFCKGLEINGKDLLYQDRYKYLYPNGKILCESNCTMNNTDFELERINCLCSYKNVFDFNRIEKETNDILNDPSFIVPTQSSLNAEAIKCLFNFTLKQTTYNNGAFYYCSVSLLVQISMVIVSATYGIKSALSNVRHLLNRENFNDNNIGRRIQFKEKDLNNDKIMTTNRPLNHPPKKKDVKEKYNEDIDLDSNIENDEFNNTILENDLDSNNNEGGNYEINLKKGNKENNKNPLLDSKESINSMKVEYIPPDYNFKFFKPNDKGVIKKIDRSKIPFEINPDTRYLLERKKGIEYPENYLNGPYFQEQNIVIITDEKNNDVNKVVNYIKKEKLQKNNPKPKNDNNDDNKNIKEEIKADYNIKKRNNLVGDNKSLSEKGEKNLILIKKINKDEFEYSEESLLKEFDEKDDLKLKVGELGLLSSIKREQVFLRVSYEKYLSKQHSDIFCVYLAEILDKIYLAKICLFLKKIDIFPIHFSLYMFCHLLLLSILTGIFSIKLIKKIWDEENFPNFEFYVLYGLIINIIIWIIYQIFLCLLDNRDKVKVLIITKNELIEAEKNGQENMNEINYNIFIDKYNSYKSQVKCKITVFYIIVFLVSLFLTIYLISFFALYTGTKRRVLKAYYISIVEILLIKFVYGFALCSLRLASKVNKIRSLYNIVCFLNKYVS